MPRTTQLSAPPKRIRTPAQHKRRMQQQRIKRAMARVAKEQLKTRARGKQSHKSVLSATAIAAATGGRVARTTIFRYTTAAQRRLPVRLGKPAPADTKADSLSPDQHRNLNRTRNLQGW